MEIGFIGAGTVAGIHLDTLREQDRATVAAVCDVDGERAEAVAVHTEAPAPLAPRPVPRGRSIRSKVRPIRQPRS